MWESESDTASAREYGTGFLTSTNQGVKNDGIQRRGHSWYVKIYSFFCGELYDIYCMNQCIICLLFNIEKILMISLKAVCMCMNSLVSSFFCL